MTREEQAKANRAKHPELAEFVDSLRKRFGEGVKVVSIQEKKR